MPELPEVEVTRRSIEKVLVGRKILKVETTRPSYFFITPPDKLKKVLAGRRGVALDRHGKYLVLRLDDESSLLLHLGMTGQLIASGVQSPRLVAGERRRAHHGRPFEPDEHTHLAFELSGRGPSVFFRDVRKFGKVAWFAPGKPNPRLDKLGVDALSASGEELYEAARARKIPIKSLLLDQAVLAGIGNIYADEALFLAGVRPTRPSRRVTREECASLVRASQRVMLRSIETGGSSISDYVRPDGSDGGYQNERRVYAREGEPCSSCRAPIVRVVIGQRSAHYCAACQK